MGKIITAAETGALQTLAYNLTDEEPAPETLDEDFMNNFQSALDIFKPESYRLYHDGNKFHTKTVMTKASIREYINSRSCIQLITNVAKLIDEHKTCDDIRKKIIIDTLIYCGFHKTVSLMLEGEHDKAKQYYDVNNVRKALKE